MTAVLIIKQCTGYSEGPRPSSLAYETLKIGKWQRFRRAGYQPGNA